MTALLTGNALKTMLKSPSVFIVQKIYAPYAYQRFGDFNLRRQMLMRSVGKQRAKRLKCCGQTRGLKVTPGLDRNSMSESLPKAYLKY